MNAPIRVLRPKTLTAIALTLLLGGRLLSQAEGYGPSDLQGTVTVELVGQAVVQSPTAAIQFGYLSRIVGLDDIFASAPENETAAAFTFFCDTAVSSASTESKADGSALAGAQEPG